MDPPTKEEIAAWKHLVVHKKRDHYDVYVGRPTKWGNPFHMENESERDDVCERYMLYLTHSHELLKDLPSLRGKRLACWCAPKRCHAETLAALANRKPPDKIVQESMI